MLALNKYINLLNLSKKLNTGKLFRANSSSTKSQLDNCLELNNKIPNNLIVNLVNQIESSKNCDSETALTLIKSCGLNLVDTFPSKRQKLLNYLFNDLFRGLNVTYDLNHYDHFMANTILNNSCFDPFTIDLELKNKNLLPSLSINKNYIQQFCNLEQIRIAFLHLKMILEAQNLNLKEYKEHNFLNSDNYFENFAQDVKNLKLNDSNGFVCLFNPLINYLFKSNQVSKAFDLIILMNEINIKQNNETKRNLLIGYLNSSNYDQFRLYFEQNYKDLKFNDLLALYLTNSLKDVEKKFKKEYNELLSEKFPNELNKIDHLWLFDSILRLCSHKKFDDALNLVKKYNSDLNDYFLKSLIEYEESYKIINKFTTENNLKTILYYSLVKKNTDLSLKLINDLKKSDEKIKTCFFFPLLIKESNELEEGLANKEINFKIEKHINFRRIESILKMIRFEHNLLCTTDDLSIMLDILRFNKNYEPRKYLTYSYISKIFDRNKIFNTFTIFNSIANKILNQRLDFIRNNHDKKEFGLNIEQVKQDFDDLYYLINSLNISLFEDQILIKLNRYLNKLYQTNLIYNNDLNLINQIENNIIFQTIKLINNRIKFDRSESLNELNNDFSNYTNKFANDKSSQHYIKIILNDILQISNNIRENKYNKNEEHFDKVENIEDLINMIIELESKNKETYPTIRRLLIKLCNSSAHFISNPVEYIEKYVSKLPESELTPMVCQDLMTFYAKNTFDIDKSSFYFEKLVTTNEKQKFDIDPKKLILYITCLFKSKNDVNQIIEIFSKVKWTQTNDEPESIDFITSFLSDSIYKSTQSNDYLNLVEKIFESNLISRNVTIANLVMNKFIEMYKLEDAFEYFKLNMTKHKTSVCEILLLKSYLKKYENKLLKGTKLENLLQYFSRFYSPNLAYNFLFLAHILNGDYYSAGIIYEKNLNKEIDLDVLKRLINQFNSSKVYRKQSKNIYKLLNFKQINENNLLKIKIKEILNKLI